MTAAAVQALQAAGIGTMAKLNYSSTYQLGQQNDASLIQVLVDAMHPTVPSASDLACLRRMFFESATATMADLRGRIERVDDTAPRKVPLPERTARYREQAGRLIGLDLTGELDCAHSLLDAVTQQKEDNVLKYIDPESCPKRDQELVGLKKIQGIVPNKQGILQAGSMEIPCQADLSSELRIKLALTRRSLAYDQATLFEFDTLNKWIEYLYAQLSRAPPPHYAQVTMSQVLAADKQLFQVLASLTREGINPVAGVKPLETHFQDAKRDPQVAMLLMPLPLASSPKGRAKGQEKDRTALSPYAKQAAGGKGKGKGKGKQVGKRVKMPEELRGMHFKTPNGETICFGYNMAAGCNYGSSCTNKHCCCKPGCYGNHALPEHPGAGS